MGPYFYVEQTEVNKGWTATNSPDWSDINWIGVGMRANTTDDLYIDDLHLSGVVVREARDASEITLNKTYMKVIRNDTAVNDTLKDGIAGQTDTGTAARLARAELLRRSQTPIVAKIRIPLAVDLLPGHWVHTHACQKSDDSYRIDKDFRVKEVTHVINSTLTHGFQSYLNLTDDTINAHAFGAPDAYSLLMDYAGALGHSEARDLKGGALDNLIPRLTETY